MVLGRDEFLHVFYNCDSVIRLRENVAGELFPHTDSPESKRLWYLTGLVPANNENDRFFYVLTSIIFNYVLWQCKVKRRVPSTVTALYDVDFLFDNICNVSSRIRTLAMTNNSQLCRRWRANGYGRG
jgi:hypothetical protein